MAKKLKNEEGVNKTYAPTEIASIVNNGLLLKPNKKVVFTSFCNNSKTDELIKHLISYSTLGLQTLIEINKVIEVKMNQNKEAELIKLKEKMKAIQQQIQTLEGK